MIINTGEKLNSDTSTLNKSANELSQASNTQATSLEETSASLEEVTQNILENTNHTKKMAQYAQDLAQSSLNGKKLANETASAMDSITQQVNAIFVIELLLRLNMIQYLKQGEIYANYFTFRNTLPSTNRQL